jgi:integrase
MLWYGILGVVNENNVERFIYDFDYNFKRLEAEVTTRDDEPGSTPDRSASHREVPLRPSPPLHRESPSSPFVFVSERGSTFTTAGFARMIERAAAGAGLEFKAHPHMLRRACGYALANKGHDTRAIQGWLGHRSITSTAVYTALAPNRFRAFWRD